jgi:hypothetical protein
MLASPGLTVAFLMVFGHLTHLDCAFLTFHTTPTFTSLYIFVSFMAEFTGKAWLEPRAL